MQPRRMFKIEERNNILIRSHTSESDISEEPDLQLPDRQPSFTDRMDRAPSKLMRMEINLASQRRENDFYIYDKKLAPGLKITEHCLVFSRKVLEREDAKV